ncbi:tripartite tricarboxylate transporter substrate binding protein [Orrella sp. NBD-18]|uniref:Tripartite tricarboxylate transporter substrate binding protein n=1 Tax=Sheuella amnicola TaxID=2707330 RepID=A0A6B2R174_9BURK|nr:tripartite tricarboxylate transporter substrate binding protein [Sheuella amnicola]
MSAMMSPILAHAQTTTYPNKQIRMVVPYPPGGPTDLTARVVAAEMSNALGQSIVVDNRPGASGMIGAEMVARAEPDGYTFLANASLHVINSYIYPDMRFDALKDFEPITQLAAVPLVLVVPVSSPIKTVKDLVEFGKKNPGKLNFGSAGNASAQQLAGESFKSVAGIEMQHVPYKGSAPALADLVGGQIQLMFDSMPSAMPFIKSGKLRPIAVTTVKRAQALPDLPTLAESGYPGFDIATWYGYWAPKGTPAAIVEKLSQAASTALKKQNVIEQYAGMGAEPVGSTPAEFARYNAAEAVKWEEIVRKSGAKAN